PAHLYGAHQVLIALDDVLANKTGPAAERLRQIDYDGLRNWDKFGYDTVATMVEFSRSSHSGVKQLSKLAGLRRANSFFWKDSLLLKSHRRATMKIAELTKSPIVKIQAYLWILGLYLRKI